MSDRDDEVSISNLVIKLKELITYLTKRWLALLLAGIIGVAVGVSYYYKQAPQYEADCTFVLDEKSGSSAGGLASLASSLGVDVASMMGGGSSLFANDNLLDILQSRRIVETVLLSEVDTAQVTHQTLADLYLTFTQLDKFYDKKAGIAGIHFNGVKREQFSLVQDSILYVICKKFIKSNLVTDRTNKKTQIFKVQVISKNERFSKLMTERMVAETKNFYIGIKTATAQKNLDRLQRRADSLLQLLNGKTYESAETQVLDANPAMRTVQLPAKLAGRNELLIGTVYTEVVKNLESTKTMLMVQTPVIQLLDMPRLPLEDNKRGLLFCMVVFFAAGITLCVFCLFAAPYLKNRGNL